MPRIVMFTPIKNEAHRYLQSYILWNEGLVDDIFIWDDQSDDESLELLLSMEDSNLMVSVRPDSVPSFMTHEGKFRQAGWNSMVENVGLQDGDWVLTLDSDNFWVGTTPREVISHLPPGFDSVNVDINEIFRLMPLSERTDGWWGGIEGIRLARFNSKAKQTFELKPMGCDIMPMYAMSGKRPSALWDHGGRILHYGYAHEDDRVEKYQRYSNLSGHSSEHIESILRPARLAEWIGPEPEVWRGIR